MANSAVKNKAKLEHKCHIRIRNKSAALRLESPLSIASVCQLKKELSQKLLSKDVETLKIDGADISSADTASLQLICSLVSWAKSMNINCCWSSVSGALLETATMLDLSDAIQLDQVEAVAVTATCSNR